MVTRDVVTVSEIPYIRITGKRAAGSGGRPMDPLSAGLPVLVVRRYLVSPIPRESLDCKSSAKSGAFLLKDYPTL